MTAPSDAGRRARPQFPVRVQREIISLDGAINPPEIDFRRDEWIIGDGPLLDTGARREYVIHTWPPRFMCRVVLINEINKMSAVDEGDVDTLTGIVYQADRETLLCEFQWIDRPAVWRRARIPDGSCF